MLVKRETKEGIVIVTFSEDRLGYEEEAGLREELWQVVEGLQSPRVLLDLQDVAYVSSGPLGVFLAFNDKVERAGGNLRFCSPSPYVEETFRATRLRRLLAIFPNRESALASWKGTSE